MQVKKAGFKSEGLYLIIVELSVNKFIASWVA